VSWQPGRDRIEELLDAGELDRVTPNDDLAQALIRDAGRHLHTAAAGVAAGDLSGAYQLAYDALRKSGAALLVVQGLRATSRGGHVAIQDAVVAQFGASVRAVKAFGRIRRARNQFEYPDAETAGPTREDVDDAIHVATATRDAAATIIERGILGPWEAEG
jgi:uncharacterized protein (UPF0332 family)